MTLTNARLNEARIDLSAIRANAAVLARRAGQRLLVADVAADGYGHGALAVARAAIEGGASAVSVSELPEALELRGALELGDAGSVIEVISTRGSSGLPLLRGGVEAVSAGAALYGLTDDPELRPAMRVSARVVGTKTIEAGDGVSYGLTYRASARTNLALVGIGYADGLDRISSNVGTLLLGGIPRTIAGRVAMNALVLELGDDTARVGDEAIVFGDARNGEPAASAWAASLGKTAAEAVSVFGAHLPRLTS